jgi:glutathione S-transferase
MSPSTKHRLYVSLRSPFARRARLALLRLGIPFDAEVVNVFEPDAQFLKESPLGQVPVLILPSGERISDSATILEHLHEAHDQRIWPLDSKARLDARIACTLAEGLMTYLVAHHIEAHMQKPSDPAFVQDYYETLERTLKAIAELDSKAWIDRSGSLTQAGWDLGVALEYKLALVLEKCRDFQGFRDSTPPPA